MAARIDDRLGYPVFVKPANLGSSVGISKAKNRRGLGDGARRSPPSSIARSSSRPRCPQAREIECAVLGNDAPEASVAGEIVPSREFYDYEAKYLDAGVGAAHSRAARRDQTAEIRRLAIEAFLAVDCAGMARVDFLLDGQYGRDRT